MKDNKIDGLDNAEGFVATRTEGHTIAKGRPKPGEPQKWHVSTRPTFIRWDEVPEELRPQDLGSWSPQDLEELTWKITKRAVDAFAAVDPRPSKMKSTLPLTKSTFIRNQVQLEECESLESLYMTASVFPHLEDARPVLKRLANTGSATRALFGCYQAHILFGSTLTLPSFIRDAIVSHVLGHLPTNGRNYEWKIGSYAWFSFLNETKMMELSHTMYEFSSHLDHKFPSRK